MIGIADLEFDDRDRCVLMIDQGMVVTIEFGEVEERLLLYSPLGEPANDVPAAYAEPLRANYLGGRDGGAMLGLQPDGKGITLSQWIATPDLDATRFSSVLERFVSATEAWQQRLPQLGAPAADDVPATATHAIRG